jgi:predicted dehydrogenase
MKVGIIGAGNIARLAHLPGYARLPGVEIAAITDILPAKAKAMAEQYKIPKVFTDYHEMLALKLDAISICVPNAVHAEATIAALESGKHVLCEKPMAMNTAEAQKMADTAKRVGKTLMMGFNNRFRSDAQALKARIEKGEFGDIYFARGGVIRRRGIPGWGSWFTRKGVAGGGALIDIGVHALDLTMWLMGKPEPVAVTGATYAKFGKTPQDGTGTWGVQEPDGFYDVDDLACAMIRFANGATLMLEASWASHIERSEMFVHILGTQAGGRLIDSPPATKIFTEIDGVRQDILLDPPKEVGGDSHFVEIVDFVDCIENGRQPSSSAADGVRVMKVLDAIYKSAATGASVPV